MSSSPTVTCLFHNAPTLPAFLRHPVGRTFAGDLLVECGLRPALSFALNVETPANYPGLAGLLGGLDVGSLAHPNDQLPAPILLAPGAAVAPAALRAALPLLRRPDERLQAVTLLVPFADARALGASLAFADAFAMAWDAAEFPHEEALDFARWLAGEKLLHAGNFAGLFPYAPEPPPPGHAQRVSALLASLTARAPGIQPELIVVA